MDDKISPSQKALKEALDLSGEILRNIELGELPLTNIALKTARLARLLNDSDGWNVMRYEASGYPSTPEGVPEEVWRLAALAGRKYQEKDSKTSESKELVYLESIEQLEHSIGVGEKALESARDPDIAVSSSNPHQYVHLPQGNVMERRGIKSDMAVACGRLARRRALIYGYVVRKHHELKFSGIADDIFTRIRGRVDSAIGQAVPHAVEKLSAVYESLKSENPEDWSNAVHSCRRILHDLADAVFPPREDKTISVQGKPKLIKLGKDNYINRIIAFVEERTESVRFGHIVGSQLSFLGDRLDSIVQSAQKGSHEMIVSREEADRYVVYTYLLVGDVLSLRVPSDVTT